MPLFARPAIGWRRPLALVAVAAAMPAAVLLVNPTSAQASVGKTVWATNFNHGFDTGGNHSYSWLSTPYNDEPQGAVKRPTIVTSPSSTSAKAARFHLDGGQQRNESEPTAMHPIRAGDSYVIRFTDYLAKGFPVDTSTWQVIMQFKNDGDGSPPAEIKIGNGHYYLDGNNGAWHYDIGKAVTGKAIRIAVRIHFFSDPGKSSMWAWYNHKQTLHNVKPTGAGTLYSGSQSYLKTGIYRDTAISQPGTRYLERLIIGKD